MPGGADAAAHYRGSFPKSARLRKRREYQAVQATGQRVSLPHFVFVITARAAPTGARIGIVASRKVGCSVVRSRAKRLVREAFRAMRPHFPDDVDMVVIVRRLSPGQGLADVVHEWSAAAKAFDRKIREARRALNLGAA